jgi:6-pyruvoyl-tetrahydropterin synthase
VVMDFHELERLIDAVIVPWHNRHLNETPAFASLNPSAENVAGYIAQHLKVPNSVTLQIVEVWETNENSAVWMR